MIKIEDGCLTIDKLSGSNYWAGQEYFNATTDDGTKIRIHMSVIHHCLTVMKHDKKENSVNKLLNNKSLWGKHK